MEDPSDCPYAILDTATGIVSRAAFGGADALLSECDDMGYWDGKTICLKRGDLEYFKINLYVNDTISDTRSNAVWSWGDGDASLIFNGPFVRTDQ
jgi:hypothetical protein